MSERTKKQHYVWEYYLSAWASDGQIWARRGGKNFRTSTENVAQERYFYEIPKLSPSEVKLLKSMVTIGPLINQVVNQSSLATYLAIAQSEKDTSKFGMEWHHTMIEQQALPILKELRNGNAAILEDHKSKIHLCIYLGHQYTRTKKIRNAFPTNPNLNIPEEYKDCDLQKIHAASIFIFAGGIGSYLCDYLDLRLIYNKSGKNLITSDQPIYNLLAVSGEISKDSSIYFPISPELALWAKKSPNDEYIDDKSKVEYLNSFMAKHSHEFIFATSEEELNAAAHAK
ncbi:DUF4238 domain-containing protein [Herbaspirillum sp. WGmk3]|uniref:DUF4238 domain-containing protein n=1 Tax=Herbaspirillum sp. WGmk3 TaxID=2919925 RepID=UPI0020909B55|nr:DUF4238 domain-containing protein [Herbaspirillum sp. WGmk3]MCO4858845.1 DUF4238 domain-containing protein [Herbaspirillum sp. WGmk3]